ncbi:MFS transporter [Rhodococcus sp. NPDC055112]
MGAATPTVVTERAGRRQWLGLALLALPTLVVALDINALFLALPQLTADLGASSTQQLWIADIYGFMVAGLVITMGTLGDRIGRRRLLFIGSVGFAMASVLAAYSTGPEMLIASRVLLGIAGATLMPSTLALITNMFHDGRQRGAAIAIWSTCTFTGAALGPVVGGLLLAHFWWGAVFLMAVPAGAVLVIVGPFVLPEFRNPDAARLDLPSVALSMLAILPLVYAVKRLTADAAPSIAAVSTLVLGGMFAAVFVARQLRLDDPLLDLRLLGRGSFRLILLALTLAGVVMAGTGLLVTQYLQSVLGHSPVSAALWFAPMGLAVAVGTTLSPAIARRVEPVTAIAAGLALSAIGAALLALVGLESGLGMVIAAIAILALGTGPLFALGTGIVMGSVPPERAGSAASMAETSNYLGGTLGIAILGSVAAGIYQHQMAGSIPAGTADEAAASAGQTVAGAAAVAADLPADSGAALLTSAHAAFTSGLHVVALIGAVVLGIQAWVLWRARIG